MPIEKFFRNRPPVKDRVRRVRGSFIKTSKGTYSIVHNGRKIVLEAEADKFSLKEKPDRGCDIVRVIIKTVDGTKRLGVFGAKPEGIGTWNIYHREVPRENKEFRGYNIGRLGFNLIEQAIKKEGGNKIIMDVEKKDVLNTALGLGYEVSVKSLNDFRMLLNIGFDKPLPDKKKIREMLRSERVHPQIGSITVVKNLKPLDKPNPS